MNMKLLAIFLCTLSLLLSGCAAPQGGAAPAARPPMGPHDFIINTVMFFLLGLFIYYMLVLKPQQEQQIEKKKIQSLKKNDRVVTSGGILGRVVSVAEDAVTIEIAQNVRIRVKPSHVHVESITDTEKKDSASKDKTGE